MDKGNKGKILIYQNEKGDTKIDVFFRKEGDWLSVNLFIAAFK